MQKCLPLPVCHTDVLSACRSLPEESNIRCIKELMLKCGRKQEKRKSEIFYFLFYDKVVGLMQYKNAGMWSIDDVAGTSGIKKHNGCVRAVTSVDIKQTVESNVWREESDRIINKYRNIKMDY